MSFWLALRAPRARLGHALCARPLRRRAFLAFFTRRDRAFAAPRCRRSADALSVYAWRGGGRLRYDGASSAPAKRAPGVPHVPLTNACDVGWSAPGAHAQLMESNNRT